VSDADALRAAILDIDAHATPLHEDGDGFTTDYLVTAGCLHRALGLIGHTAAKVDDDALAADRPASGGADQEDADPFAALRALPEWQALVEANNHFDDANVSDLIAYVRHSAAAAALVAAIPGAPSTDPAPEPGEAT
jgi:hypothetical protein